MNHRLHALDLDIPDEMSNVLDVFADDIGVLKEIVHEFTANRYVLNILTDLENAIANQDYSVIIRQGHKLKGCFSYFHVQDLNNSAAKLEQLGKENADWNQIATTFAHVRDAYLELEAILVKIVQKLG